MSQHLPPIDPATFERERARGRFLLELGAPRCGPCRALEPIVASVAARSELRAASLDVDAHPEVAVALGIRGIPTLVLFEDGKELRRRVGWASESAIRGFVEP